MRMHRRGVFVISLLAACAHPTTSGLSGHPRGGRCFEVQVAVDNFCIDKYEAYVVDLDERGEESPHSPYDMIGNRQVRAKVARGVVPQAYISQVQARAACEAAGKRLCRPEEFIRACRGANKDSFYPYGGQQKKTGACNEGKGSFVAAAFGMDFEKRTYAQFNDPRLNQMKGGLAPTGAYEQCVSPDGVFDMVGNLHEWVEERWGSRGRFRGGWYGDAEVNGPGCHYVTSAHEPTYHDYSTGFRCCADAVDE
jgi:formylglycine-generating enzyme required for sulfatase activity